MDMENSYIYNDKLELRVLELRHIDLATEADRARGLVRWASLFKATTWKEIKIQAMGIRFCRTKKETTMEHFSYKAGWKSASHTNWRIRRRTRQERKLRGGERSLSGS